MMTLPLEEAYAMQVASHRRWLRRLEPWRRTAWESRLASDPEAAICEARARELLVEHCDDIEPYEDRANGGPDFMIRADGETFFVEVTSMSIGAVTAATGLPSDFEGAEFRRYTPLTHAMLNEARGKTRQLANLDRPALLFLCTLHGQASATCFNRFDLEATLISQPYLAGSFDPATGEAGPPQEVTDLASATFLRWQDNEAGAVRRTVSAIVGCGFGVTPARVRAAIHPDAVRPIEHWPFPTIEVCRIDHGYQAGRFKVRWD